MGPPKARPSHWVDPLPRGPPGAVHGRQDHASDWKNLETADKEVCNFLDIYFDVQYYALLCLSSTHINLSGSAHKFTTMKSTSANLTWHELPSPVYACTCAPLQAWKEEARHANEEMEKREKEGEEEHNEGESRLPHSAGDEGAVDLRSDMCSNFDIGIRLTPSARATVTPCKGAPEPCSLVFWDIQRRRGECSQGRRRGRSRIPRRSKSRSGR